MAPSHSVTDFDIAPITQSICYPFDLLSTIDKLLLDATYLYCKPKCKFFIIVINVEDNYCY